MTPVNWNIMWVSTWCLSHLALSFFPSWPWVLFCSACCSRLLSALASSTFLLSTFCCFAFLNLILTISLSFFRSCCFSFANSLSRWIRHSLNFSDSSRIFFINLTLFCFIFKISLPKSLIIFSSFSLCLISRDCTATWRHNLRNFNL